MQEIKPSFPPVLKCLSQRKYRGATMVPIRIIVIAHRPVHS